jgi:multicomponent Na+:H+ antiporter subunit G
MYMAIKEWIAFAAFLLTTIFGLAGLVGLFRFPDPYSRMQSGSLCGTTAIFSSFIGALVLSPHWAMTARIVIIMVFFLISAPTGSYIVARFIWQSGTSEWRPRKRLTTRSNSKEVE